ncbi:hypothetical protein OpiT1DRAFT_01367 [Opitutaceae bacterium TAV1]|nr:hypothetical protein OpiT1DRAFT_01367 [Opitutaceae bacterium TAV1]
MSSGFSFCNIINTTTGFRGARTPGAGWRPGIIAALLVLAGLPVGAHPDASHKLEEIDRHLADQPDDPALLLTRAEILLERSDVSGARASAAAAAAADPRIRDLGYVRARILDAAGDRAGALALLRKALQDDPRHLRGQRLLSAWELQAGNLDDAIAAAGLALESDGVLAPDDFTTCARLLVNRGQPGDDRRALAVLDRAITRFGSLTGLQYMACDIEVSRQHHDAALARIDALVARYRPRVEFELRRSDILSRAGRRHEASRACDRALALLDALPPERRATPAFRDTRARIAALRDDFAASSSTSS